MICIKPRICRVRFLLLGTRERRWFATSIPVIFCNNLWQRIKTTKSRLNSSFGHTLDNFGCDYLFIVPIGAAPCVDVMLHSWSGQHDRAHAGIWIFMHKIWSAQRKMHGRLLLLMTYVVRIRLGQGFDVQLDVRSAEHFCWHYMQ